tara:strand:+ start:713 stop:985 length:273 start_codon:yes stop_codon:yes gene_type:complete
LSIYKIKDKSSIINKTIMKKTITAFSKDKFFKNFIKFFLFLEVPEGFEPSTSKSVASRSNPIELWDRRPKISKKIGLIKQFFIAIRYIRI